MARRPPELPAVPPASPQPLHPFGAAETWRYQFPEDDPRPQCALCDDRVEDMVAVTEKGRENLTRSISKDLAVL